MDPIFDWLQQNTFATGSRVLGGYTSTSDYDFLLTQAQYNTLTILVPDLIISREFSYEGAKTISKYIEIDNKSINLIIADTEEEYQRWRRATNAYLSLGITGDTSKELRILIFTHFRESQMFPF